MLFATISTAGRRCTTGRRWCREGPSSANEFFHLALVQRRIPALHEHDLAPGAAEHPPDRAGNRHQFHDGPASLRNHDLFAHARTLDELGELGLSFVDIYFHISSIASSP